MTLNYIHSLNNKLNLTSEKIEKKFYFLKCDKK